MIEEFRPIEGFPGYFARTDGQIISMKGKRGEEHVMSQTKNKYGYAIVMLCKDGVVRSHQVARLVLAAFEGYPADPWLCYVRHLDGDLGNCNLYNLKWEICQTTEDYDPSKSHRRGVLKPDYTRERMTTAKYCQSEYTIAKQVKNRRATMMERNHWKNYLDRNFKKDE